VGERVDPAASDAELKGVVVVVVVVEVVGKKVPSEADPAAADRVEGGVREVKGRVRGVVEDERHET